MSLNDVISSDEFQNRFGVHTKPFQEFAAYILIMAREHTDLSVREVGAYVKNLMQEKHKLELDLAEFSQSNAGQADEIKRLKQENKTLVTNLARDQKALREAGFTVADDMVSWKAPLWHPEDSFHKLCIDACHEANRARGLFPSPAHLSLALAEEAGEVTKAVLDHKQGKCDLPGVRKEIVQTMAMCIRLATEGDPTVDLKRSQE